jgi:hypothetical protein
MKRGEE